jgi:hypothetical protein
MVSLSLSSLGLSLTESPNSHGWRTEISQTSDLSLYTFVGFSITLGGAAHYGSAIVVTTKFLETGKFFNQLAQV